MANEINEVGLDVVVPARSIFKASRQINGNHPGEATSVHARRMQDRSIASAARAALHFDLGLSGEKLTVVVNRGVVSLFGTLDHDVERAAAVSCVSVIEGVVSVADNIISC